MNSQIVFILNTMYNDNLRQIRELSNSNTEIRNIIVQIFNSSTNLFGNFNTNSSTNPYTNLFGNFNTNPSTTNPSINRNTNSSTTYPSNNLFGNFNTNSSTTYPSNNLFGNSSTIYPSSNLFGNFNNSSTNSTSTNTNNTNPSFFSNYTTLRNLEQLSPIIPTLTQFTNATRQIRYADIILPNNTSCPISLNTFLDNEVVTIIKHCNHIFNNNSLNNWFKISCKCPVCRYDIRNYNIEPDLDTLINDDTNNDTNNDTNDDTNDDTNGHTNDNTNNDTNNINNTHSLIHNLINRLNIGDLNFDISNNRIDYISEPIIITVLI